MDNTDHINLGGPLSRIFFHTPKMVLFGIVVLALLVVIPITLNQLQNQQDIRQRAAGEAVSIILSPLTKTVNVGEVFLIPVSLNTGQNNVSGINIEFEYDPELLTACTGSTTCQPLFTPSPTFSKILLTSSPSGTIHYLGVNLSENPLTGSSVSIGTLAFKAKAAGIAEVGFSKNDITASGIYDTTLPIDTTNTRIGRYTIIASGASTPTSHACTQDARICPDGSAVGRVGPNCEFAPCPTGIETVTPTPATLTEIQRIFDFNDDGKINEPDLNILLSSFKKRIGD